MTELRYTTWIKELINKSMMGPEPGEKAIEIEDIIKAVISSVKISKDKFSLLKEHGFTFTEDEVLIKYTEKYLKELPVKEVEHKPPQKVSCKYKVGDRVVVRGDMDDDEDVFIH